MKLSLSRDTRHERDTKQASKQRATRTNKNQSMKEQRTAPPSLINHSSLFFLMLMLAHALPIDIERGVSDLSCIKEMRPRFIESACQKATSNNIARPTIPGVRCD